jgi:predicted dehydrogenase/threonine dehydrogenase-like Zn-dependent dehydrogenase
MQNLASGETELAEVPVTQATSGHVLIRSRVSLISAGTERMLVQFGRAGLLEKARQQPEKVRMVLEKVRTDGLLQTVDAVRSKLDEPLAMGYCNAGFVVGVGEGVQGFKLGDRVASNGSHTELISVPQHLCARIPDSVPDESAAFTVLGAIALQGIRLAQPTLGECFVVSGLGLIGLITVQILRAHGCRVLGIDVDPAKVALAREFGAEAVELAAAGDGVLAVADAFSRGRGVDGVLLTLSSTSSEPVSQAARMCRKRARIVLVGVAGLHLNRADFYEKELSFQVSCSYGPGRYDPRYEQQGQDYPVGFVRWTEQRNFEAVLDLMASGALNVLPLITHRFPFEQAAAGYDVLARPEPHLGILLEYPQTDQAHERTIVLQPGAPAPSSAGSNEAIVAVIGAGNYAGRTLIPALAKTGARLYGIASAGGVSAAHYARKHGFERASTDAHELINDAKVNAVVVATRHDSHARLAIEALQAGKHVFVEKPLALTIDQLNAVEAAYRQALRNADAPVFMVGFNRRFAPHVKKIKALLAQLSVPKSFVMTVNAGAIPAQHWTHDPQLGGGRIIGECCHFIDLLRFLAAPITDYRALPMQGGQADSASIQLQFEDGSIGTVHYFANGSRSFPKERLEVFVAGRVLQLDNFVRLRAYGWPGFSSMRLWRQDKGQRACAQAFVDAVCAKAASPISFGELMEVSRTTIGIAESVAV